jgi:hypothetical protein
MAGLPFEEVGNIWALPNQLQTPEDLKHKAQILTTAMDSGISKRYRLEKTGITSYGQYNILGCK